VTGPFTIVGQGLAGTCVAWQLWKRGVPFSFVDHGRGASLVAAGLINPVTGKNFEPSWRIAEFLPEALGFYAEVEQLLGIRLWYPMPVLRLAGSEKEWRKISSKLDEPHVSPWVGVVVHAPEGWAGAVEVIGGGRLHTKLFVEASREFFAKNVPSEGGGGASIFCEGAKGLLAGKYGAHRSAKGEILAVRAEGWDESRIRVGGGGWLVPIGDGLFRAGATYEWNELNDDPTEKGRNRVEEIVRRLGGDDFEVIDHVAGIRPILRRSEPLIGRFGESDWMFNGLGSKGSLYAPGVSARLINSVLDDRPIDEELSYTKFSSLG
jgi:glycine oxidase